MDRTPASPEELSAAATPSDEAIHFPVATRLASVLGSLPPTTEMYLARLRSSGVDVITMVAADPQYPPPAEAGQALATAAQDVEPIRGPHGSPEFRAAVARWYQSRFHTSIDPEQEVLPVSSVEEAEGDIAHLFLNPDDVSLVPDPCRPSLQTALAAASARIVPMPLRAERDFLPELSAIPAKALERARILWLDYPNLPTGAIAPAAFFHNAVHFARQHQLLLVHLSDHSEFTFDNVRAFSVLEVYQARLVSLQVISPAHMFHLHGWPAAAIVGQREALRMLRTYRQRRHMLSFGAAQRAVADVLRTVPMSWTVQRNAFYQHRRDQAIPVLEHIGLFVQPCRALPALWASIPPGYTAEALATTIVDQVGVWVTPGTVFGPHGEGYVRVSLTLEEGQFGEALRRLSKVVLPERAPTSGATESPGEEAYVFRPPAQELELGDATG